jgi:hypothetical protein
MSDLDRACAGLGWARPLRSWLERSSPAILGFYAAGAAFSTYFCMYAYRKPFAVATFPGELELFGLSISLKIAFVVSQVLGYTASKFAGIRVISELPRERRAVALVAAIAIAELSLVGFGMAAPLPAAAFLFVNGFALGFVWGLVVGFLEGRRTSDALAAGLSASFIVASGFVKSVGKWLLDAGISEAWMPAATGALFAAPILVFIFLLSAVPPPSREDELARQQRAPMNHAERVRFFLSVAPGLVLLTLAYVVLAAYRDFRDNFARELWAALGYGDTPEILTAAEIPVAVGSLLAVALVMWVRNNRRAVLAIHGLLLFGALLMGGSTWLFELGVLDPGLWMVLVGLGLYMGYVPYNCVLFDRLIPAVGVVATAGFLIYVTDALGYLGSVLLLLYKNFASPNIAWLPFFVRLSYASAAIGALLYASSFVYFSRRLSDR